MASGKSGEVFFLHPFDFTSLRTGVLVERLPEEGLYYGRATAVGAESTGLDLPFQLRWPQAFGVPHHQRNRENSLSHRFACWRHCSQSQ